MPRRTIALVVILVAVVVASCRTGGDLADNPARVYQTNCSSCHGVAGAGGSGGSIIETDYEIAVLTGIIRNGQGTMPAFGRVLSDAEIDALVTYVREELGQR